MTTTARSYSILFVLFACLTTVLHAQQGNVKFRHLGVEDGLSHVTINEILQDSYGFLWLGTTDGLNRFNGYELTVFKNIPGDSTSLTDNVVNAVFEDAQGEIWVGTFSGLHKYDRFHQTFQKVFSSQGGAIGGRVYDIVSKSENELWIGSSEGLAKVNTVSGEVEKVTLPLKVGMVNRLLQDANGNLWLGSLNHGIFHYEPDTEQLRSFEVTEEKYPVWDIHEDHTGIVWVGLNGAGLWKYNSVSQDLERFDGPKLSNDNVLSIFEDKDANLWIGTNKGGLNKLNSSRTRVYHYSNNPANTTSLSSNDIRKIFQDKNDLLWFGTWGGGLNLLNPEQGDFARYTAADAREKGHALNGNFVQAIYEGANGNTWVGTKKGLNLIHRSNGMVSFPLDEMGLKLTDPYVKSIFEDDQGKVWIGAQSGLNVFDPAMRTIKKIFSSGDQSGISYDDHLFFYENSQDHLWIGTWKGLNRFNQKTGKFENENIPRALRDKAVLSITEDADGRLWIGTYYDGVYRFDPETGALDQYQKGDGAGDISNNRVWTVHTDKDENVWIGTFGGGLNKVVEGSGGIEFEKITEVDGLANNAIIAIQSDKNGILWVASNKGISRFNPATGDIRNYDSNDGLQGDHFNAASHAGRSGKLYFGGSNGLSSFDPLAIEIKTNAPEVIIESFELFNKATNATDLKVLEQPIMDTESITLTHGQRVFSFAFSSSYFDQSEKLNFSYQLEGFDPEWINASHKRRYVNYTSIPAGTYTFKVRASNKWGVSGPTSEVMVTVLPPWWQSWWFISLAALLVFSSAYLFYRSRINKIKRQNQRLEQQVAERTTELKESHDELKRDKELIEQQAERLRELDQVKSRFFANISHELRTPLTLINAPLETLVSNGQIEDPQIRKTLETARSNGVSLLSLVEEILDLAKLDAGKLKLVENPVRLRELLSDIIDSYSTGFASKAISFQFNYNLDPYLAVLLDENKCGKIVRNLLSNALKFSPENGAITLTVDYTTDVSGAITLQLADTGQGIHPNDLPHIFDRYYQSEQPGKKAEGGTGIGLALARELATLQGGSLSAISEIGIGSTFSFQFPARHEELKKMATPAKVDNQPLHEALGKTIAQYNERFEIDKPVLLVTEDHQEMRAFIASTLSPYFTVKQASQGKEALELLRSTPVDIMISDVMMPEMDGFELLEAVKKDEALHDVSVIMLTARAEEEDKLFALTMGIDDYLTKPFSAAEFLARIKNILENRIRIIRELKKVRNATEPAHQQELKALYGLSERELEVIQLMAKRSTNLEMAETLHVSLNTIKYHIKNIYLKLDVSSRSEAAKKAEELFV